VTGPGSPRGSVAVLRLTLRCLNPAMKVSQLAPDSIRFFRSCNLNYVSCSPYRVPVARLAAAQAELEFKHYEG